MNPPLSAASSTHLSAEQTPQKGGQHWLDNSPGPLEIGSHFSLADQSRSSPGSKSEHTPSVSRSHCQLLSWGHQPRAGLGLTASKSINLITACVPGWVERDSSKENKHATAAGGTSAQPVPGLARRLCLFSSSPTHTQITNLPAPCSANASFCKQKLDAPEGLTGRVQVDACEETPPFLPIPGKNSGNNGHRLSLPWDALRGIQTSALPSTYSKRAGTEQPGVLDHLQSITAQEDMAGISPQWPLLDVPTAGIVVVTASVISMGSMGERRLRPTSLLIQTKCLPATPESNQNPKQRQDMLEGPEQSVYTYVAVV